MIFWVFFARIPVRRLRRWTRLLATSSRESVRDGREDDRGNAARRRLFAQSVQTLKPRAQPAPPPILRMIRTDSHGRKSKPARLALPHVALIVETSTAFGRATLSGISPYVHEYRPWSVYIEQCSLQRPARPWLEALEGRRDRRPSINPLECSHVVQELRADRVAVGGHMGSSSG